MKLIERILFTIFLIALTLKFNLIAGGSTLLVFTIMILSLLYFYSAFLFSIMLSFWAHLERHLIRE